MVRGMALGTGNINIKVKEPLWPKSRSQPGLRGRVTQSEGYKSSHRRNQAPAGVSTICGFSLAILMTAHRALMGGVHA